MGQAGSTNRVAPQTEEAARLDLIMGKDREALGRGQLNKAVDALNVRVRDTADQLEQAVNMLNGDGTSQIQTAAQVKERDRQVATAKVDTGLTKKREKSIDQVGGSIPSASAQSSGAALAKFGERKSATKNARRSLQRLASLTKLTWRDRIKNAERKAGKAFMTARLFMRAGGETVMSEHPPDFLHALPPILTDLLGQDAERFSSAFLEIDQYIFARPEGAAAAGSPKPVNLPGKGKATASGRGQEAATASGRGQQPPALTSGRGQQLPPAAASGRGQQLPPAAASGRGQQPPPPAGETDTISAAARQRIIAAALRHVTSFGTTENVELRVTQTGALTALNANLRGGQDNVAGMTADIIKAKLADSGPASTSNSGKADGETETLMTMTDAAAGVLSEENAKKIMDLLRLMQVHVNNANSRSNPPAPWHTANATDMLTWSKAGGGKEYDYFSDIAMTAYRNGQVAIYIDCSGEGLQGSFFHSESCPYALAQSWNAPLPVGGVASKQIRGLPLGQRQLTALALAVEKLLGRPVMDKIRIVLTLAAKEESLVIKDLIARKFYGFNRKNVLLLVHHPHGAYRWVPGKKTFEEEAASDDRCYGTGFAVKQLGWIGECFTVGESGAKEVETKQSALSLLAEAGVHAVSAWKCGDLGRLIPEDVLDIPAVSFMYKSEDQGAACAVQVNSTTSLREGMVVRAQYVKGKQLKGGMVVALSPLRCNTADAAQKLLPVKDKYAPTGRWQFVLQPLATALGAFPGSRPNFVWTPCMRLAGEEMQGSAHTGVYPDMDICDLTVVCGLPCTAYRGGAGVVQLRGPENADTMLRVVGRQDADANFQDAVSRLAPAKADLTMVVSSMEHKRFTVVLLVSDSPQKASLTAFKMATLLLRPGVDELVLLHVARDTQGVAIGAKIFEPYVAPLNRMLNIRSETLVAAEQLPVAVEQYCDKVKAHLVIMGSEATAVGGKVLGSMALAVAKRISYPLLVVKTDAENRVNSAMAALKTIQDARVAGKNVKTLVSSMNPKEGPGFRVMFGVEAGHVGIEMLKFTGLLLRKDYDTIVLARCANVDISQNTPGDNATARLLASFEDAAHRKAAGFTPIKKVLPDGKGPMGLVDGAAKDGSDILVHQAPPGTQLPADLVEGLTKCRSAMLIYRHTPQFDINDEKWNNYD